MDLTVMICARDAAATIERAVNSVLAEPDVALLLVDDDCRDDTVERARRLAGDRLRVIQTPGGGGIPLARQAGLEACSTSFAAWLDADDAWIAGRAARIVAGLRKGYDVVADAIALIDGSSNRYLRTLTVPDFLKRETTPARLFERNYLPGDTQIGFCVATFREAGGYDARAYGTESFDMLLRVVANGRRFAYLEDVGYRMFAYEGSVSRDLDRQRRSLARVLAKHDYEHVRELCRQAGESARVVAWVLVSLALFREEPEAAMRFLDEASPADADPEEILEKDGPWPFREGWRRAFARGTCLALLGGRDAEAVEEFERARRWEITAEVENNLGVVLARLERWDAARVHWREALRLNAHYFDARANLQNPEIGRITTHPMRRQASRSEY